MNHLYDVLLVFFLLTIFFIVSTTIVYPLVFRYVYFYVALHAPPKTVDRLVFDDFNAHNFTLANLVSYANTRVRELYVYVHTVDGGYLVLSDGYEYPFASLIFFLGVKTVVDGEPRVGLGYDVIAALNITAKTLYVYTCIPEYVADAFHAESVIVLEQPRPPHPGDVE